MANLLMDAARDLWERVRVNGLGGTPSSPIDGQPMYDPAKPHWLYNVRENPFNPVNFAGGIGGPRSAVQTPSLWSHLSGQGTLKTAQEMQRKGALPETILRGTGWWQDPVGNWKFEFSDKGMKLKFKDGPEPKFSDATYTPGLYRRKLLSDDPVADYISPALMSHKSNNYAPVLLKDIMEHPELFRHYPQLENLRVGPALGFYSGAYGEGANGALGVLRMNSGREKDFAGTLLHEIQHAIQGIENTPRGGNPDMFTTKAMKDLEKSTRNGGDILRSLIKKHVPEGNEYTIRMYLKDLQSPHPRIRQYAEGKLAQYPPEVLQAYKFAQMEMEARKQVSAIPYNKYRNLMGEQEAEAVAQRFKAGTSDNIRDNPLWNYFTVPYEKQGVRGN